MISRRVPRRRHRLVGAAFRAVRRFSAPEFDPHKIDGRRWLLHDVPPWVDPASTDFFITVCCQRRGTNQLCLPGVGDGIVSAARFYHEQRRWLLTLFLVMPDHVHMLVSFGRERGMIATIGAWKRYLANQFDIAWQRNFFDHRPRTEAYMAREAHYILQNPVRAGLVQESEAWPFVWAPD